MKFYGTTILFMLLAAANYHLCDTPYRYWVWLGLGLLYLGITVYGSTQISSQFYVKALCRTSTAKARVALTFDDGPEDVNTAKILELLKKHQAKASFFVIGERCKNHPDLVKQISEEGHLIGNHTFTHSNFFPLFSVKKMREELAATQKIVKDITQSEMRFFRPPFGVSNPLIARALSVFDLIVAGWSIRTLDTVKNKTQVLDKIRKNLKAGDIILLHNTSNDIVAVVEEILKFLDEKSLKAVRIDEL